VWIDFHDFRAAGACRCDGAAMLDEREIVIETDHRGEVLLFDLK
jgi:hypothetical protein